MPCTDPAVYKVSTSPARAAGQPRDGGRRIVPLANNCFSNIWKYEIVLTLLTTIAILRKSVNEIFSVFVL